ncbi:MAG: hypothetical protein ACRDO2_14715 [Nocardioidaceae bacterium]
MTLTLCRDLSPADWIVHSVLPWQQLVGFGPAGFDAYARVRFLPDPMRPGQSENDVEADWRLDQLPTLWDVLATHTAADDCYFCVWEGFGPSELDGDNDAAYVDDESAVTKTTDAQPGLAPKRTSSSSNTWLPKVVVPNRAYWLFRGPLSDVGSWDTAQDLPRTIRLEAAEPAFVWPADHVWCVALDVDQHWAGIGADSPLITKLTSDPRLDVVTADPTQGPPFYQ